MYMYSVNHCNIFCINLHTQEPSGPQRGADGKYSSFPN